jgi:PAS domain S-box-containing protein
MFGSNDWAVIRSYCRDDAAFEKLRTLLLSRQTPVDLDLPPFSSGNGFRERVGNRQPLLFATGPVIVFHWRNAPHWPVEFVSGNVTQLGYQAEDFISGRVLYGDIVHPDDVERVATEVEIGIAAGKPAIEQSYRVIRADGEVRWVYDLCGIVRNQDSEVTGFEGYVMDISDRKRSEEALRESEERFAAAFWCSPTALTLSTLQPIEVARIVDVNDSFLQITGYSREEVVGQTVKDLNIWVDEPARAEMLYRLQTKGVVTDLEMQFRRKSGRIGTALMSAEVIHLKGESCLLTVTIDITDRKQAQEALQQSEARNRAFVSAIPDLMFRIARDGTYLDCKADKTGDFALPPEDMIGRKVQEVLPPPIAEQRMYYVQEALRTGKMQVFEYQFPHGQELRDYEARLVVSGEDEVMAIMRDITERKRNEAKIRANDERNRLLGEMALRIRRSLNLAQILNTTVEEVRQFLRADRVFIGQIKSEWQGILAESTNPEWVSILTWITDDLHLREIRALFAQGEVRAVDDTSQADVPPGLAQYYARCQIRASLGVPILQEDESFTVLVAQQCAEPHHWTEFEIQLMRQLANQVTIAIQQAELYEQVQNLNTNLEQEVQERTAQVLQKMQEVEELSRVKDEFLYAVSHDLKTPVMGLLMVLKNLQAKAGESVTLSRPVLERMVQSCDRQIAMINSLLDAHSAEIKGVPLQREAVHLAAMVRPILDDLEALFLENRVTLDNQIAPDLPPVYADSVQLRRVFENLITNAIKHNPPGLRVTLGSEVRDGMVRCTVGDNGVGMTPAECQTLFERYARSKRARRSAGIGLGLYVSRQIVTAHGGSIGANSAPNEGATFWFTLPLFTEATQIENEPL